MKPSSCTWAMLESHGMVKKHLLFHDEIEAVKNKHEISVCDIPADYLSSLMLISTMMKKKKILLLKTRAIRRQIQPQL